MWGVKGRVGNTERERSVDTAADRERERAEDGQSAHAQEKNAEIKKEK